MALGEVGYVSAIKLVASYIPPKSCRDHMLEDLPPVLEGVSCLEHIVAESVKIAESRLQHLQHLQLLQPGIRALEVDEAIAIASYTFDLGLNSEDPDNEGRDNLYYVLNLLLRERHAQKMKILKPYLTYLMRGLAKLPPVDERVYRGVPASNLDIVFEKYLVGMHVHWRAFTSTSTIIARAMQFAQGPGGIIFRINCVQGRRVASYSAVPVEDEVGPGNSIARPRFVI